MFIKYGKYYGFLLLLLCFCFTTEAQTRRRGIHIHLHKPHLHRLKYLHLKREDVQFDLSADFLQQQFSFTNTINVHHFFNSATVGASLDKNILFTDEAGWTDNKETVSVLFDGSKSTTGGGNDFYAGAKGERVLRSNKKLSFSLYTYPKWSISHHQVQFEEGAGAVYNFSHGFLAGYDISLLHQNLKSFSPSISLAVVKIL